MVTDIAFLQTPAAIHKFLPIFTLGAPYDKFIDQHPGAASPDSFGNYFYTSAPPLTFVVPFLATVAHPSLQALRWYNVALQCLAAAAMGLLVELCLRRKQTPLETRTPLTFAAAIIYMTAPECLRSHSINLWSQQFYAVLLPIQIMLLLFRPIRIALFLTAFIGCLADWTAYVADLSMIGVALWEFRKTRDKHWLWSATAILLGSTIGGLVMIAWFAQVMPVEAYFQDLARRSEARSTGGFFRWASFMPRYIESFGLFLPVALIALIWRNKKPDDMQGAGQSDGRTPHDPLKLTILIFACALLENLLMKDHALLYSYDRLKGIELLILVLIWAASKAQGDANRAFWLSSAAGLACITFFHLSYETPGGSNYLVKSQQQIIGGIIATTASPQAAAFFSGEVRGSEVYYAGRNIVQLVGEAARQQGVDEISYVRQWSRAHGFDRGTLYDLSGSYPSPLPKELPRKLTITEIFVDGRPPTSRTVTLPETPADYHPVTASDRYLLVPGPLW